jgi:peptidoglycan/LPS O-acetylase OafA/YrhL
VLGVVSMTWLERHQAQARRAVRVYSMAVAMLIAVAAVTLLTQSATSHFLHGLIA